MHRQLTTAHTLSLLPLASTVLSVNDDDLRTSSQAPLLPGIKTQADVEDNRKSLNRRLADKLLLLVKDESGEWRLPSTAYAEAQDAGLRQVWLRSLCCLAHRCFLTV